MNGKLLWKKLQVLKTTWFLDHTGLILIKIPIELNAPVSHYDPDSLNICILEAVYQYLLKLKWPISGKDCIRFSYCDQARSCFYLSIVYSAKVDFDLCVKSLNGKQIL